nr:hypothetical protein [Gemmatimonadota bacterium]
TIQESHQEMMSEAANRMQGAAKQLDQGTAKLRHKLIATATGIAIGAAVVLIATITWLRPGRTMTDNQHEALRVGSDVIYQYQTGTETHRADLRRVMGWKNE